jgi:hypothetical protein
MAIQGTTNKLLKTSPQEHIAIRKGEFYGAGEILKFPTNIGAHATLIRFFKYTYGGSKGSTMTPLAEVLLPLPKQIQDSFKINVAGDELGVIGTGSAEFAGGLGRDGGPDIMGAVGGMMKASANAAMAGGEALSDIVSGKGSKALAEMAGSAADAGGFFLRAGLGQVAPDIANGIGAGRGTAVNPFQTLVFKGVDLKVHSLEWLLSPETEQESRDLRRIIRTLQRMVLPKTESAMGQDVGITAIDKGILRYPAMCNIYLQGLDQNYFFKFKTSMISQLNIDYTPNGIAPLKGGKPSAVRITMTLNEAYIHTAEDNMEIDLDNEELAEKLADWDEDIDGELPNNIVIADGIYSDAEDFTNQTESDEITLINNLPDGSQEEKTMLKSDLARDLGIGVDDLGGYQYAEGVTVGES